MRSPGCARRERGSSPARCSTSTAGRRCHDAAGARDRGVAGVGRAIAGRLVADGVEVVLADIDGAGAERAAAELAARGARATALPLDVADEAAVTAAYAGIDSRFGRLDILVNNAGIMDLAAPPPGPVEATPLALWERTLKVNLSGAFLMCRGAVPLMRRGRFGRIVNISSRVARTRNAVRNPAYAASKGALIGLSRVLASEVGGEDSGLITGAVLDVNGGSFMP